jgi:aquaporin Z
MVMVFTIGPVSGCHINPAVSIAAAFSKRMNINELPGYLVSQCLGAIAASGLLLALMQGFPNYTLARYGLGANGNPMNLSTGCLLSFEIFMTAIFMMVILTVTRPDAALGGTKTPAFAAFAIGGFLFVAHLVGVPLGDSSLNPARSLGPALFCGGHAIAMLMIFIPGPIVGAVLGLGAYRLIHAD